MALAKTDGAARTAAVHFANGRAGAGQLRPCAARHASAASPEGALSIAPPALSIAPPRNVAPMRWCAVQLALPL